MKYALELYSVRKAYDMDLEGTLQQVADIGYEGAEGFGALKYPAERVRDAFSASGLVVVGWHTALDLLEEARLAQTVTYFHTIGNTRAVVPSAPHAWFETRVATIAFAEKLNLLGKRLAPEGIALGYHNHGVEFVPYADGDLPWQVLMDHTDTPIIAQLDNGNALSSLTPGLDMTDMVKAWPGRAKTVHLKPFSQKMRYDTMILEDDIDWPAFLAAAQNIGGAQWGIVEYECETRYAPMDGVRRCLEALRKV